MLLISVLGGQVLNRNRINGLWATNVAVWSCTNALVAQLMHLACRKERSLTHWFSKWGPGSPAKLKYS